MPRNKASFHIGDTSVCKQQMLNWANRFSICCFMDSHDYEDPYSHFDCLLAAGAENIFFPEKDKLLALKNYRDTNNDWLFGHIGYDLKNEIEELHSCHTDQLRFPDLFFFRPSTVLYVKGDILTIESVHELPEKVYEDLMHATCLPPPFAKKKQPPLRSRITKDQYLVTIAKLKEHILRGDCYEINFCQEFFSENTVTDPLYLYQQLSHLSPSPFAVYYKLHDKYALCASPERYIQKHQNRLISQPIKGTAKRNAGNGLLDDQWKEQLRNSPKERAENVMITDLVRNDLSRVCKRGSVKVEELFGIYTYAHVHQMISTIQGEVDTEINIANVIQATFPMGSMTGAPKRKVMQLTEQYESSKRGLYSGCIGYITPDNNFDFMVVIRSILYNQSSRYLSFHTGGAITFASNAEEEYKECLLKAEAMMKVISM